MKIYKMASVEGEFNLETKLQTYILDLFNYSSVKVIPASHRETIATILKQTFIFLLHSDILVMGYNFRRCHFFARSRTQPITCTVFFYLFLLQVTANRLLSCGGAANTSFHPF